METINLTTLEILSKVTDSLGTDVKRSLREKDRYATGETESSISTVQTKDTAQLVGARHIYDLEYGKKPGEWPKIDRIRKWCAARGIDLKRAETIRLAVYRRGYKGTKGVITNPLSDQNIDNSLNRELGNLADLASKEALQSIN